MLVFYYVLENNNNGVKAQKVHIWRKMEKTGKTEVSAPTGQKRSMSHVSKEENCGLGQALQTTVFRGFQCTRYSESKHREHLRLLASFFFVTNTLLELLQNESFNRSTLKRLRQKCNNCTLGLVISEIHDVKSSKHTTSNLDSFSLSTKR